MNEAHLSLGDLSGLRNGAMQEFPDMGSHGVVVCRVAGKLHAVDNNCSHKDTPLSEGRLRGPILTCPLHGAQFDVRDGSHQGPPAVEGIACYKVTEAPDGRAFIVVSP